MEGVGADLPSCPLQPLFEELGDRFVLFVGGPVTSGGAARLFESQFYLSAVAVDGFCQNSGLADYRFTLGTNVRHAALTSWISCRHRDMNTSRRAANDAGVLLILK